MYPLCLYCTPQNVQELVQVQVTIFVYCCFLLFYLNLSPQLLVRQNMSMSSQIDITRFSDNLCSKEYIHPVKMFVWLNLFPFNRSSIFLLSGDYLNTVSPYVFPQRHLWTPLQPQRSSAGRSTPCQGRATIA